MKTTSITDEYMREMRQKTKPYTLVILHKTPKRNEPGSDSFIWEHGRRNYQLRRDGKLLIVCPVRDSSDIAGIGIFSTSLEETQKIMDEDPAVQAKILIYEVHSTNSFPGDALA
jgi:hypothetical protein